MEAGEMAEWLTANTALTPMPGSLQPVTLAPGIRRPLLASLGTCTQMHIATHTELETISFFFFFNLKMGRQYY